MCSHSPPLSNARGTTHWGPKLTTLPFGAPKCFHALFTPMSTTQNKLSRRTSDTAPAASRCSARSRPMRGAPRQAMCLGWMARCCDVVGSLWNSPVMSRQRCAGPVHCNCTWREFCRRWAGNLTCTAIHTARRIDADHKPPR